MERRSFSWWPHSRIFRCPVENSFANRYTHRSQIKLEEVWLARIPSSRL